MGTPTQLPEPPDQADIAVIGGSGFYAFLDEATTIEVSTPFGAPSGPVSVGEVAGRRVAFIPRHGPGHQLPPHRINYRANAWALRSLGVRQVLAPCAVGGLTTDLSPGDIVVPDQVVDRTTGRIQTFVEAGANHVPFADPYCAPMRRAVLECDTASQDGGTMVVIDGPRFSTRAESRWYAAAGWSLVNMTGHPEAVLARELQQCYCAVALVTDLDAGIDVGQGVSQQEVLAIFARNLDRLRVLMTQAIAALPDPTGCSCSTWARGMELTYEIPGPAR